MAQEVQCHARQRYQFASHLDYSTQNSIQATQTVPARVEIARLKLAWCPSTEPWRLQGVSLQGLGDSKESKIDGLSVCEAGPLPG